MVWDLRGRGGVNLKEKKSGWNFVGFQRFFSMLNLDSFHQILSIFQIWYLSLKSLKFFRISISLSKLSYFPPSSLSLDISNPIEFLDFFIICKFCHRRVVFFLIIKRTKTHTKKSLTRRKKNEMRYNLMGNKHLFSWISGKFFSSFKVIRTFPVNSFVIRIIKFYDWFCGSLRRWRDAFRELLLTKDYEMKPLIVSRDFRHFFAVNKK